MNYQFSLILIQLLVLGILVRNLRKEVCFKKYSPFGYKLISFFILISTISFVLFMILEPKELWLEWIIAILMVISFMFYLSIVVLFIGYFVNFAFTYELKRTFPFDKDKGNKEEERLDLKELSKFMSVSDQTNYKLLGYIEFIFIAMFIYLLYGWIVSFEVIRAEMVRLLSSNEALLLVLHSYDFGLVLASFSITLSIFSLTQKRKNDILNQARKGLEKESQS